MRLMKKLAIALSSVVAFTAVPFVTMAASNAIIDTPDIIIGSTLGYKIDAEGNVEKNNSALNIFVQTTVAYQSEQFLVKGTDVSFDAIAYGEIITVTEPNSAETVKVERLSNDTLRVSVANIDQDRMFTIPVSLKVTGANPALNIIGNGGISSQTISLASKAISNQSVNIKFGEQKNIPIEGNGTLGEIIIDEVVIQALNQETEVVISLATNSGLVFDLKPGSEIAITGAEGFAGINTSAIVTDIWSNNQKIKLVVPALDDNRIKGSISIANLPVAAEERKVGALCDEVVLDVEVNNVKASGVVSQVMDYEVFLHSKTLIDLVAGGESQKIKFTLNESVAGSLNDNLHIFIAVEGADIVNFKEQVVNGVRFSPSYDRYGNIIEIVAEMTSGFNRRISNAIELELELMAGVNETGLIEVTAESRGFDKDLGLIVGTINNTVGVQAEGTVVEIGLQGQVGGQIVIKETVSNVLEKNEQIIVELVDAAASGIRLQSAKVEATNGIQLESRVVGDCIVIDITRESGAPGEVIISDVEVTVGQNAPFGGFKAVVGGTAISNKNTNIGVFDTNYKPALADVLTIDNFITTQRMQEVVTMPRIEYVEIIEDVKVVQEVVDIAPSFNKVVATIDINSGLINSNNSVKALVAKPFTTSRGNVMVGVRDIATIFNIAENEIMFENGKILIKNNNIDLEMQSGSEIMKVNGINLLMDEKVEVIDGRTFVSAKYMALALGLDMNVNSGVIELLNK